jgi:hypothetical protein
MGGAGDVNMRNELEKPKGVVRQLPAGDPRDINHPSHREQWDALAEAIGRMAAREDFARMKAAQEGTIPAGIKPRRGAGQGK